MAQISGRKLRGTPSEPIVNLGGEFSRLAEEEGTHKAQLARVHAELAVHKEAPPTSGSSAASRETVAQLREHSADLEATIRTLLGVLDDVDTTVAHGDAEAAAVAGALEDADAAHAACEAALNETVDELEQTRAALDGELAINSMQSLRARDGGRAALAKAREEATEKNRTYSEAYMRHKRVAQQLQAKERQVALLLNEKGRMQKLLEKKDVEAREAVMALKKISTPRAVPASPRSRRGGGDPVADAHDGGGPARAPARPDGGAARLCRAASPFRDAAPTEGGAAAAMPGVKMSVNEWRNATPAQKTSALRAENQVLIGVLRERDEALKTAEKELAAVKKSYAALQVRWRGATGARRPASADATPSPTGDAPSPGQRLRQPREARESDVVASPGAVAQALLASPGVA